MFMKTSLQLFILICFLFTVIKPDHAYAGTICGDVNLDHEINIADMNVIIDLILDGGGNLMADVNYDGEVNIADVNVIIDIILGGKAPTPPETLTFTVNCVTFKMKLVEGGTFMMGVSEGSEIGTWYEKPSHQVTLTGYYYMAETEVTQELWLAVMGKNWSRFSPMYGYEENLQRPTELIAWNDCQTFIAKLNQLTGMAFRLPTEAEWEFAARGGTKSKGFMYFSGSDNFDEVGWSSENIPSKVYHSEGYGTQPVATKAPNELGLYDMSGNVSEWCQDWEDMYYYQHSPSVDPTGPGSGDFRIYRGGRWDAYSVASLVYRRGGLYPVTAWESVGMRLAL
jgi:formylglycine-generating enzyme required for sulfatase activity